jgi:Family of unknown function (DUF6687)
MSFPALRFEAYGPSAAQPNVVVDGSANAGTVLTLSHWPGAPTPQGVAADLSAQMAFRYLDRGQCLHDDTEVVTNNHFDQDGLVSAYALVHPEDALRRRPLLEDLAAAGDFATFTDRRAARASMVLAAYADADRSPLAPLPDDYAEVCAVLYDDLLGRLPELLDGLDAVRPLWADEDDHLTASEKALAAGVVTIDEHPLVDLAVVTVDPGAGPWSGHRFASRHFDGLHPMALHNATDRFGVLLTHGRRHRFTYRYETWVQYRSRPLRPRVDLAPLAERLSTEEAGGAQWQAGTPDELTPDLAVAADGESSLDRDRVVGLLIEHLIDAPPAWDPFTSD